MATTLTDLQICNRALLLLGTKKVQSITGDVTEYRAQLCQEIYALKREEWLTEHPWRFNMEKVQLDLDATAPVNEWQKRYELPCDGITNEPYAVFNTSSVGAIPLPATHRWEIFNDFLFTNENEIWIDYQINRDEGLWPVWFQKFAIFDLASELAFPITDQENTAEKWMIKARGTPGENGQGGAFGQAMWMNSQLVGSTGIYSEDLLDVRYGG